VPEAPGGAVLQVPGGAGRGTGAAPPGSRVRRRRGLPADRLPFLLPGLVLMAVLLYIPMLLALYMSSTALNQYTIGHWLTAPFAGLGNFVTALDPSSPIGSGFLGSIQASAVFAVMSTLIAAPIGVGAGLLMNSRVHGRRALRVIMLVPYVIPSFVTGIVWRLMFENGWGLIDRGMKAVHLSDGSTYWLIGGHSLWALIITDSWASWPFIYMMTLAALQQVPDELREAAIIDGAGTLERLRRVTLPLLWPTLSLALLFSALNHLNNFALPYVMFGSSPPSAAAVMPVTIYTQSFGLFNFGLGAAMSILSLLVMLLPAVVYMRATRLGEAEA
jgi:multiple sugar transport system permease protein